MGHGEGGIEVAEAGLDGKNLAKNRQKKRRRGDSLAKKQRRRAKALTGKEIFCYYRRFSGLQLWV
jgi:hypothetical protein